MSTGSRVCPGCNGAMRAGFLLDRTHHNQVIEVALPMDWVAGDPGPVSWWRGGIKLSGRDRRMVVSYVCDGCGLLQSFAEPPEDGAEGGGK